MLAFVFNLLRPKRTLRAHKFSAEPLEQRLLLTRLAVIGDYSSDVQTAPTRDVASLVKSWSPDGVVTAGDNNYPGGAASTIDANIGQWYHQFIYPYTGSYGAGSADGQNHFWPTLGNHDWDPGNVKPYTNYFTLPNNERYYTVQIGNIALFVCDGESQEPDGTSATSTQGQWIQNAMLKSTAQWKLVLYHEPVYSSGSLTNPAMNWPFKSWGATAVITGHDHNYERLSENGLTYFVDGLGGESIVGFNSPIAGSQVRYNGDYGALRVDSTDTSITFTFVTRTGQVIDTYTIGTPVPNPPTNPHATASPGQIALSWSASTGATGYNVYRGTTPGGEGSTPIATNVTGTSYTDTAVNSGTTYYYVTTAKNSAGESADSVEVSASLAAPPAPGSVVASGGIKQIALSWGASAGAATYNVYRGTSPGGEGTTPLASNLTGTSFTDSSLSQGATFYYTVKAVNGFGNSPASSEVSATVMSPPAHVVVVVESHFDPTIIQEGSGVAPYIQSLMDGGALFSLAQGVTYPGQPNYLALFSGSTQGITDDTVPSSQFTTANLGAQLIAAGLSFTGYAQGLPSVGSLATSSGAYFRYHNPWSDFSNIPSTTNQTFTAFPSNFSSLPTVSFVVPDFNNDMHDGTITQGDTWLQSNLGAYATWATTHNSLLVVTWDDNASGSDPANSIATIVYGQPVQTGVFNDPIDHYDVLRTIEDLYGLSHTGNAATASTIQDAWHAVPVGPPAPTALVATSGGTQQISLSWSASTGATGYNVYRGTTSGGESPTPIATGVSVASFNDTNLTPGVTYYYQVTAVNASGESVRSLESSAVTQKATPVFSGLTSPTITYGALATTISGTIAAGSLIPTGTVGITINGVAVNASITPGTGAFATSFDTHLISASATGYTITFNYAGNTNFNAASDTSQTLTVNKRSLTVTATGINRVYDGTTSDTVTLGDNRVNSDALTVTCGSALFADKAVGTGKAVGVSGISVTGAALGNYTLANTTATTTANITARALTVSASGSNKVYDGTASDTVTLSDNRIAGDVFTNAYTSAAFPNKNVGTGKTVTVSGISISGADAGNYSFNTTTTSTANITVRTLTVTPTGVSKVYDATTSATVTTTDNRIAGDVFTVSDSANFATKFVATAKPVSVTGIAVTGTDAANYSLSSNTGSTTADITSRPLTITATGVNRAYDGTVNESVTLSDNRVAGDVLSDSFSSATFADKNIGTAKPVSVTGLAITGDDAANYSLTATTASTAANITARALTVSATGAGKTYDRTTSAAITLSDNRIAGDVFTDSYTSASFADKNAGASKTITVTGIAISGADSGNYSLSSTTATTTASIAQRSLTVTAAGVNRTYNGTTSAAVTFSDDRLAGDVFTDTSLPATFADKNVGAGKSVSVTVINITGTDAANYALTATTASTTADITARSLTVTVTGVNKTYDATSSAAVTLSDNRVAGDSLTEAVSTATFADKNVGTAKGISATGISVTGPDAANYTLTSTTASGSANITARSLTVTATGTGKTYDATTSAIVTLADNRIPGDTFTDTLTSATFSDKNVGTGKAISVTGIAITGLDAANYTLTSTTASAAANITARSLTVTATGVSKTYDATAGAIVTLSDDRVAGDVLTDGYTVASFADKNVGMSKAVSVTGISVTGADAANYALLNTTASATADVTPLSVTGSVTVSDKVYDTTTDASLLTRNLAGVLGSDAVTLAGGTATFDTKDVGAAKTVTVTGLTLSGSDAGNYVLSDPTDSTAASVTPAPVTGTITVANKPYDATAAASVLSRNLSGVLTSDVVDLVGGTASFDTKNVGAGKAVTVTGLSLTGADAGNYKLTNATESTTADVTPERLITGTAAADTFKLVLDNDSGFVDWFVLGNGSPVALGQVSAADAAGLTAIGVSGTDTLVLDYSAGNPLPATLHLSGTFVVQGLSGTNLLAGTAIEIGQSTIYFAYTPGQSPVNFVRQALARGYNNGAWTGTPDASTGAIVSANAASGTPNLYGIGYADSADGVVTGQPADTVEVRYTVVGDANLDRVVNMADATLLQSNFNATNSPAWTRGNFNYDSAVNALDAVLMTRNYTATATGAAAASIAPATPTAPASTPATLSSTSGFTSSSTTTPPVSSPQPMTSTSSGSSSGGLAPVATSPAPAVTTTPAVPTPLTPITITPRTTPLPTTITPRATTPTAIPPVAAKKPVTPPPPPQPPVHHEPKKPKPHPLKISVKPRHAP